EVERVGEYPDEGVFLCGNQLEIDVNLTFETQDGLFDEAYDIPLRINSHSESSQPEFDVSLGLDGFNGSLALDDFAFQDGELTDLVLHGNFDEGLLQGGLSMEVLIMDWVGFGVVANFDANRSP